MDVFLVICTRHDTSRVTYQTGCSGPNFAAVAQLSHQICSNRLMILRRLY